MSQKSVLGRHSKHSTTQKNVCPSPELDGVGAEDHPDLNVPKLEIVAKACDFKIYTGQDGHSECLWLINTDKQLERGVHSDSLLSYLFSSLPEIEEFTQGFLAGA